MTEMVAHDQPTIDEAPYCIMKDDRQWQEKTAAWKRYSKNSQSSNPEWRKSAS